MPNHVIPEIGYGSDHLYNLFPPPLFLDDDVSASLVAAHRFRLRHILMMQPTLSLFTYTFIYSFNFLIKNIRADDTKVCIFIIRSLEYVFT
jgi:hypothetical protein